MMGWIRHSGQGRRLLAAATLLALAIRLAVPVGFMPTTTQQGVVIAICTSDGMKSLALDLGQHQPDGNGQAGSDHCIFASGLSTALAGSARIVLPMAFIPGETIQLGRAIAHLTVNRLAAPPPPSQAPPAQA